MCDPVSIGLTLAGTAFQAVGANQVASAQRRDVRAYGNDYTKYIADSGANFDQNRTKQNDAFNTNTGTVADTLANYSAPNQQKTIADAAAKRESAYVSPLEALSFAAPTANASSAVTRRNAVTASDAKSKSISEALSKADLDAYGDANTTLKSKAAGNASNIAITGQNANRQQQASDVEQNALSSGIQGQGNLLNTKMTADQSAGSTMSGIGDLFSAAGMLSGMGGGLAGLQQFGARNGISALAGNMTYSAIPGVAGSGVYASPLAAL